MTFIEEIKESIANKQLSSSFTVDNLKSCENITKSKIKDISNYDIKNSGSENKNKKVLISKINNNETYYSFCKDKGCQDG
jgi:hypothetical protein